jgi:hypothetical protein
MRSEEAIKEQWAKDASDKLLGKKIVSVRYLNSKEQADFGDWFRAGVIITLEDGNWIAPMQDDEGNGPGAMATSFEGLETIPVI